MLRIPNVSSALFRDIFGVGSAVILHI